MLTLDELFVQLMNNSRLERGCVIVNGDNLVSKGVFFVAVLFWLHHPLLLLE